MGILIPGDPWNFVHPSQWKKIKLSHEEIEKKTIKIWQSYTIDECINRLRIVVKCFTCFASNEDLLPFNRYGYEVLSSVANFFQWAFEMLNNGYDSAMIGDHMSDWFNNNSEAQRRRGNFYAVEKRLNTALMHSL
jgi:hypothetical protein